MQVLAPILCQSLAHRIAGDVPHLSTKVFILANDMVVEVFLPSDAGMVLFQSETCSLLEFDHRLPCVG